MSAPDCASVFGRHEFLVRRLHSLLGLVPVGGFLVFHLATNMSMLDGVEAFQYRVNQIHDLGPTTIMMLEWPFIFLPILLHGIVGLIIVCRGKRNLRHYPYLGNFRYTLQRWTGVIAFVFIVLHVFHMHGWLKFQWWTNAVARPLGGAQFDPDHAITAAEALQASVFIQIVYAAGILACVYHFANGLWTMGITWGVWTGTRAQHRAGIPCAAIGLFLAIVGLGALFGMVTAHVPQGRPNRTAERYARHSVDPPGPESLHAHGQQGADFGEGSR